MSGSTEGPRAQKSEKADPVVEVDENNLVNGGEHQPVVVELGRTPLKGTFIDEQHNWKEAIAGAL